TSPTPPPGPLSGRGPWCEETPAPSPWAPSPAPPEMPRHHHAVAQAVLALPAGHREHRALDPIGPPRSPGPPRAPPPRAQGTRPGSTAPFPPRRGPPGAAHATSDPVDG